MSKKRFELMEIYIAQAGPVADQGDQTEGPEPKKGAPIQTFHSWSAADDSVRNWTKPAVLSLAYRDDGRIRSTPWLWFDPASLRDTQGLGGWASRKGSELGMYKGPGMGFAYFFQDDMRYFCVHTVYTEARRAWVQATSPQDARSRVRFDIGGVTWDDHAETTGPHDWESWLVEEGN